MVWRDIYGPQDEKIEEANPFVKLLWEKGVLHEKKVVEGLGDFADFINFFEKQDLGWVSFNRKFFSA